MAMEAHTDRTGYLVEPAYLLGGKYHSPFIRYNPLSVRYTAESGRDIHVLVQEFLTSRLSESQEARTEERVHA